jgi:hypothetical protein
MVTWLYPGTAQAEACNIETPSPLRGPIGGRGEKPENSASYWGWENLAGYLVGYLAITLPDTPGAKRGFGIGSSRLLENYHLMVIQSILKDQVCLKSPFGKGRFRGISGSYKIPPQPPFRKGGE